MILTDIVLKAGDLVETGAFRDPETQRRQEFRLTRPVLYEVGGPGSGLQVTVPAGYRTDLYSLPGRLLLLWEPKGAGFERWILPALVHDWLYDIGRCGRARADGILFEAMRVVGVPLHRRLVVWLGVRLGGWRGWGTPTPENFDLVNAARNQAAHVQLATAKPLKEIADAA